MFLRGKTGRLLASEGLPLGILPNPEYHNNCIQLQKGDSLLLYSDALIEAPNKKGERMGIKTFKTKVVKQIANRTLEDGLNNLLQSFFEFSPPPPPDDVTTVLLRWEEK